MGDLPGIISRLPYLKQLGVDAVWISPFYRSPQADAGYDVADYKQIDPRFGTLSDAENLIKVAHGLGLRVIFDIVPNHTSDEHPWFQAALAAGPGSPERDRYMFRDGKSDQPPNDWPSEFGGIAWEQVPDGQWYLHMFHRKQADLNWRNPEVREMFVGVLRFWLDRGVDGFRVDVAHSLIKAEGLPDMPDNLADPFYMTDPTSRLPFYDQDDVHEIYREWRAVLDSYPGDRAMVAEAWVKPISRTALYARPDEFNQTFNFPYLELSWDAATIRERAETSLREYGAVGAPSTWVLSNHDTIRIVTRLSFPKEFSGHFDYPTRNDPPVDEALGRKRARALATFHARPAWLRLRLGGRGARASRDPRHQG
jgi:alpha-glucosidase